MENFNQKFNRPNSRRTFLSAMALGATAGISAMANPMDTNTLPSLLSDTLSPEASNEVDANLKRVGKKKFPVAFDGSQANPWPIIWSNVYFMTNEMSGTSNADLGVITVLRHSGILFTFKDDLIKEYGLSKEFGFTDPNTGEGMDFNPFWDNSKGLLPEGFVGISGLMEKGAYVCACDMAYKHYSAGIANRLGLEPEKVYNDFVAHKHDGIDLAPSGVWVLGRMASYGLSYIDASVD